MRRIFARSACAWSRSTDEITDATLEQVRALLADPARRRRDARHNFRIGRQHLGSDVLRRVLIELLPLA